MFWYLLNILIIMIAGYTSVKGTDSYILDNQGSVLRKKRACVVATINCILMSGLRHISIGADTLNYVYIFKNVLATSWEDIYNTIYQKYVFGFGDRDPAYLLLQKIFQIFSQDYRVYFFFVALLYFIPLGIALYRHSTDVVMSYVLFISLYFGFFGTTGIRQTIVSGIIFYFGVELILKRKLFLFLLLIILLSTIHGSAICFIPFYWLSRIKIDKFTLISYWVAIILSFVFKDKLLVILQHFAGYKDYTQYEGAGAPTFTLLMLLISLFISFYHEMIICDDEFANLSVNAVFIGMFFSSLLMINPSFMRVVQYYSVFLMYVLPQCQLAFKEGKSRRLYSIIVIIALVLLLIQTHPQYKFCWQK